MHVLEKIHKTRELEVCQRCVTSNQSAHKLSFFYDTQCIAVYKHLLLFLCSDALFLLSPVTFVHINWGCMVVWCWDDVMASYGLGPYVLLAVGLSFSVVSRVPPLNISTRIGEWTRSSKLLKFWVWMLGLIFFIVKLYPYNFFAISNSSINYLIIG